MRDLLQSNAFSYFPFRSNFIFIAPFQCVVHRTLNLAHTIHISFIIFAVRFVVMLCRCSIIIVRTLKQRRSRYQFSSLSIALRTASFSYNEQVISMNLSDERRKVLTCWCLIHGDLICWINISLKLWYLQKLWMAMVHESQFNLPTLLISLVFSYGS